MKTNKTFEQYKKQFLTGCTPAEIGASLATWNAALASVVEEPVLTEDGIAPLVEAALARIEGVKSWHPHTAASIAHYLAGRILASKPDEQKCQTCGSTAFPHFCGGHGNRAAGSAGPALEVNAGAGITPTPQQEGGMTREWLRRLCDFGYTLSAQDIDAILDRHTQALEAVRKEATEGNQLTREEHHRVVADLTQQLAEAKKGRYAIPPVEEWDSSHMINPVKGFAVYGFVTAHSEEEQRAYPMDTLGLGDMALLAYVHRPQAEVPTIEQMMEEWVEWYERTTPRTKVDDFMGWKHLAAELEKLKGDMESLWRRDCKGGVK